VQLPRRPPVGHDGCHAGRVQQPALSEPTRRGHSLEAVLAHPPSARVAERAREVRARWREAFGEPPEPLVRLGLAVAARVRSLLERPLPPPAGVKPPTRWTLYRPGQAPRVRKRAA
jgi:hypothetical protein